MVLKGLRRALNWSPIMPKRSKPRGFFSQRDGKIKLEWSRQILPTVTLYEHHFSTIAAQTVAGVCRNRLWIFLETNQIWVSIRLSQLINSVWCKINWKKCNYNQKFVLIYEDSWDKFLVCVQKLRYNFFSILIESFYLCISSWRKSLIYDAIFCWYHVTAIGRF